MTEQAVPVLPSGEISTPKAAEHTYNPQGIELVFRQTKGNVEKKSYVSHLSDKRFRRWQRGRSYKAVFAVDPPRILP